MESQYGGQRRQLVTPKRLTTLSEASVRRNFDPYTDIDWDAAGVLCDPERPTLGADRRPIHSDVIRAYRTQPREADRDRDVAGSPHREGLLHLESILVRGLMQYSFWVPNGSPEYRYCLHESVEECNHSLMFQEMVNRIGVNVPGMPRYLRWVSPAAPAGGGPAAERFLLRGPGG